MTMLNLPPCAFELTLTGALDADRIRHLRADLDYLAESDYSPVVLNLGQVDLLDASGIGAIVYLYKRLACSGRTLQLAGVQGQPLKLIQDLRIDRALPVQPA